LNDNAKELDEIMDEMKYDQSYDDMLQYLSVVGSFNLAGGTFSEWYDMSSLATAESIQLDFKFLDSITPSLNPDLGSNFQSLLMNLWKEDKTDIVETVKIDGIPNYLPIKLSILGKACAGKRTIAKQL
jgi:hypothetical protein